MTFSFKLYITGNTPRSERAITNLRRLCEQTLGGAYTLEVIDVLERPEIAETERVLATPTLVKEMPLPVRRITGDLGDARRLVVLLSLDQHTNRHDTTAP